MFRKLAASVVMGVCGVGGATSAVSAAPMWYDFERQDRTPVAGYTHVDHTTAYSGAAGYGWLDTTGLFSRFRSGFSSDNLLVDNVGGVKSSTHFRIDLANGLYQATVVGGDAQYASYQGFLLSGDGGSTWTRIGRDPSTDLIDGITFGKALPYTYKHDSQTANWNRWPGQHDLFNVTAGQYLHGKDIPLSVTAGYLLLAGGTNVADDGASYLNFMEITAVPEPASLALMGLGGLLLLSRKA